MNLARYTACLLLTAFVLVTGCATTPNPLAGWQRCFKHQPGDQVIEKDYSDFIQQFKPTGERPAQVTGFYLDGKGQHAVNIEIFGYNQNASWQYALIYDKDNKRVKVIKYGYCRYQS
jgi:hypothetical protein